MALNLSTLTSATTSGDILAEIANHPQADFLDQVPVLRNIARGPNKGSDAKQTTALKQPKALPVVDGKGYLYLSGVSGNYASVPDPTGVTGDLELIANIDPNLAPIGWDTLISKYVSGSPHYMLGLSVSQIGFWREGSFTSAAILASELKPWVKVTHRVSDNRVQFFLSDDGVSWTQHGADQTSGAGTPTTSAKTVEIGAWGGGGSYVRKGQIYRALIKDGIDGTPVLNIDFTAKSIPHGAKKFQCATGQTVTINQAGNDPVTIIKRSVLRFNGSTSGLSGLFNQTITGGHFFAAFSVLGGGGANLGRIFGGNSTGAFDYQSGGFALRRDSLTDSIQVRYNGVSEVTHSNVFDGARGDFLLESPLKAGDQNSKINNADADDGASSLSGALSSEEFDIGQFAGGASNAAFDLEYLALFPALSPAEAARVVTYINNRNNVFDLIDGFGHYFYDGAKSFAGAISSGSSSWNGRIVGSDNGDVDKYATQATASNQPVSDGYKVTFADNTDFLTIPSTTQSGWQICGTSLGTFAYRVNGTVTELNLLGNLGNASYRQAGDLYGIILLPETATGADIESARQVLINRGAADATTASSLYQYWRLRDDIVEFKSVNTSGVNSMEYVWRGCTSLTSFPALDTSSVISFSNAWHTCTPLTSFPFIDTSSGNNFTQAWQGCATLTSFPALDMSSGANFSSAWQGCTALTSFPAGAQLGTAANNVNFQSAWQSSGLTALPAGLDLSKGNSLFNAFLNCTSLTTVGSGVLLGTASSNVQFTQAFYGCAALTSLPAGLDLGKGYDFQSAFQGCTSLVNFPAGAFNALLAVTSNCFVSTWDGCTALSATSVFNILSSIDTSGRSAPAVGPDITIDYNVATGALSAATNTAIDSLSGKGWQVVINGALVIPNILDLSPAVAYSLRSFDSAADPNVVNVRRSDSATADFKASEVSDGTLTTWVGSGNDGHITTWYDQSSPARNAIQIFASEQPKIVESGVLVTEGGLAAVKFHTETSYLFINHATLSGQASLDSYYVTNATGNQYLYPSLLSYGNAYGMTAELSGTQSNSSHYGSPTYYANGTEITGTTRGDVFAATSGGQKLVAHIGADTTLSQWGSASMNFGNYINNGTFGYTGKLQEMIFFNSDQSANRTGIEKNINDTYTIY